MKKTTLITLCLATLLFVACGAEEESNKKEESAGTYLDSRTEAVALAKESMKQNSEQNEKQDKALEGMKSDK